MAALKSRWRQWHKPQHTHAFHLSLSAAGGIQHFPKWKESSRFSSHHSVRLYAKEPKRETLGYYTQAYKLGSSAPRIKVDKVLKSVLAAERRKRERRKTMDGLAFLFYLPRIRGFQAGYVSSDKRRIKFSSRQPDR